MTTPERERLYAAQHEVKMEGKQYAIYNPHKKPIKDLPVIYGFNNGGSYGWYQGLLLAEDGTCLGGHICSHEAFMRHDLGIWENSMPDRHENFRNHYPDGYRMDFVPATEVRTHSGLLEAYRKNQAIKQQEKE